MNLGSDVAFHFFHTSLYSCLSVQKCADSSITTNNTPRNEHLNTRQKISVNLTKTLRNKLFV